MANPKSAGGRAAGVPSQNAGLWREGKLLVVHRQVRELPPRCIKTCQTTDLERIAWTFSKTPGGMAGAVGTELLLGRAGSALLSASAEHMPLSISLHRSFLAAQRRINLISGITTLLGVLVTIAALPILMLLQTTAPMAAMTIGGVVGGVGIAIVAVGGAILMRRTEILKLERITSELAWFSGASTEYLAALPGLPAR